MFSLLVRLRNDLEHPDDVAFKVGQNASTLGEELGGPQAKARLIGTGDVERGVDDERETAEGRAFAKSRDEGNTVDALSGPFAAVAIHPSCANASLRCQFDALGARATLADYFGIFPAARPTCPIMIA